MLVARTGLSPVMVGRTAELSRLQSLVGASRSPAVALIAGEAGIGKTRLARELIDSVEPATVILAGQADPGTVGRPMELFLDSLRSTNLDAHPELSAVVSDVSQPAEDRVRAGVDLVRLLTSGCTSLVVFEDLHWADSESLTLFERLAEPDGGRLLVVGTYRPDGLSRRHPAGDLLTRLERRHAVTNVRLNRLAPADVSGFLAAVFGADPSFRTVDALHRRTGGNPFFLEELVASAGDMSTDALATAPLPWTIAELVRAQLDELDPAVRGIITAASVLGRRVSFDMLAAVTGTEEDELIALLRSAVDSGLLVEADPDTFSFHHDLAREAIRSTLLGRERRRLNEAALDVLQRSHSRDHVAMALHAQGAERYDQMVTEARLGAQESLRLGSTYQALQLAETGLAEAEDDLGLRGMATKAAWLAGLLDDAAMHGDLWLRHSRAAGDISEEAAALSLCLRIAYDAGDLDEMDTFTQLLINTIDQLPGDEERAQAMAFVAQSYMLRDQILQTCDWADKAYALATANGYESVGVAAMVEKGSVLVIEAATADEGAALLRAAVDEAERIGDHLLAARALINLVWQARQSSEIDEARDLLRQMRHHAEAAGFDSLASHTRVEAMALLAAVDGDLDTAIAVLDEGARDDPGRAVSRNRRWLAVLRAGLALEAGDLEFAAEYVEDAKPTTARSLVGVLGLDVHLAARRGDLPAARAALTELLAAIRHEGWASPSQAHDITSAGLAAGLAADELRPLVGRSGDLSRPPPRRRPPVATAPRRPAGRGGRQRRGRRKPVRGSRQPHRSSDGSVGPAPRDRSRAGRAMPHRPRRARRGSLPRGRGGGPSRPLAGLARRRAHRRPAPSGDRSRRLGTGRAHRPGAGSRRAGRRKPEQRGAGRAAVHLAADGSRACVEHPRQAGHELTHRDRHVGCPRGSRRDDVLSPVAGQR